MRLICISIIVISLLTGICNANAQNSFLNGTESNALQRRNSFIVLVFQKSDDTLKTVLVVNTQYLQINPTGGLPF